MNAVQSSKATKPKRVQHLANFELAEKVYLPNFTMPRHTHERAHISVVLGGTYTERYARQEERFAKPSLLVFHPPDENHSVVFHNQGAKIFSIEIKSQWLKFVREYSNIFDSPKDFDGGRPAALAARIYGEFQRTDEFSPLIIEGLIFEIIAETSRRVHSREQTIPGWLGRAKDFLHQNFAENFSLAEVARACDVHSAHLSRVFREKCGCTVGEYVRRLRLDFASRQIVQTDRPLGEIAHAAGFSDQSHLNKTFRSIYGLTPLAYRKTRRCG